MINVAAKFVETVLLYEEWFVSIDHPHAKWDVIFLGGSAKYNLNDSNADLDIFVVMPRHVQKEYNIKPVHNYSFDGHNIEVSKLSSEQMHYTSSNKDYLFHWHNGKLLKYSSTQSKKDFYLASNLDTKDKKSIIWTNFVEYKINSDNIKRLSVVSEPLSLHICYYDNLRLLAESILVNDDKCHTRKWIGKELNKISPIVYKKIVDCSLSKEIGLFEEQNNGLDLLWTELLVDIGFSEEEINNWESCNLSFLMFQ